MSNRRFSDASTLLPNSATHGATAKVKLARGAREIVDLSIGALDEPTDPAIDCGVIGAIQSDSARIHGFTPVKGSLQLREAIASRVRRINGIVIDPGTEVIATAGGIKGALTIAFHLLLNPGDEVLIPSPNWPHYGDMVTLHGATARYVPSPAGPWGGLDATTLRSYISDLTSVLILGDCINPTGKVYSGSELMELSAVVARENIGRSSLGYRPIHVIFDCPYEAYIFGARPPTLAALTVSLPGQAEYSMRQCTLTVTGPGKTYGMHGDRIGYLWADSDAIVLCERIQANTNSFPSSYGQIATSYALQDKMDKVSVLRAQRAKENVDMMFSLLASRVEGLGVSPPEGGYFLFVDFSAFAPAYELLGYGCAEHFLAQEAQVATIGGAFFGRGLEAMDSFVRVNCGRRRELLLEACDRICDALHRAVLSRRRC